MWMTTKLMEYKISFQSEDRGPDLVDLVCAVFPDQLNMVDVESGEVGVFFEEAGASLVDLCERHCIAVQEEFGNMEIEVEVL